MNRLSLITMIALLLPGITWSQDTLDLSRAVQEALNSNYGIQVAQYNVETAETNTFLGATGLLPRVSLTGGANYNNNNVTAELVSVDPDTGQPTSEEVSLDGIQTYGFNTGIGVDYTVFDGLGNMYNYRVLKSNLQLTKEQTRGVIEGNLAQVMVAYYQLARLTLAYELQLEALATSRERLTYIRNQLDFGSATKLFLLNAQVDLNTDSITVANAAITVENARRDLNVLMGREVEATYAIRTDAQMMNMKPLPDLQQMALAMNPQLQAADEGRKIAELNIRVAEAARYPRLSVNANYGYNFSDNGPVSFARTIQSLGLAAGANLSFNIFDGNRTSRNIQSAQVGLASSRAQYREAEQNLLRDLSKTFATYRNNREILRLNQTSLEAAQMNFDRTREAFELGQANSVEFRQAQLNLLLIQNQLNNIRFDVKLNEIELLRLSGQLSPQPES
ncbi:MAG: TolC family protein [Bacteroidota bacterium]